MVQVDLFLAYGIGAAFTLAAAPASRPAEVSPRQQPPSALTVTLLYLSLLFLPSGLWLLQRFPAWESMQVSPHPPGRLPAAFPVGSTLAGIAGFVVTRMLLHRGAPWAAVLQGMWPAFAVHVIFVYGWDGTGPHRLLTADAAHWPAAAHQPIGTLAAHWITTPVARTVGVMVAVQVPIIFVLLRHLRWNALRTRTTDPGTAATRFAGTILIAMIVLCGLAASILVLLVNALGPVTVPAAFATVLCPFLHPRGPLARTVVTDTGIPHHAPPAHTGPDRSTPAPH